MNSTALGEQLLNWVAPRAGTLTNFRINVFANTLTVAATYTIRLSPVCNLAFAPTILVIAVPPGMTGCFFNAGLVPIVPGDRVSLEAFVTSGIGVITATGGLEVL